MEEDIENKLKDNDFEKAIISLKFLDYLFLNELNRNKIFSKKKIIK